MKHLGGHSYRWDHSTVSLRGQTLPVDWGWIAGTNIHVKTCIYQHEVSLYKWDKKDIFHWVPIQEVTTQQPTFGSFENNTVTVFPEIYINGLPIPFEARAPINHPIHKNPINFLHDEQCAYPQQEYSRDEQRKHAVIMIVLKHQTWLAHVKNLTLQPRAEYQQYLHYRAEDKQNYVADYMDRAADLKRSKVI
jgi:hypothetical protein